MEIPRKKMMIKLKVKPNSKEQNIEKNNGLYHVKLKSSPENNKANLELVKFLKEYFKKEVRIKSGFTSKNKIVEILK